MSKCKLEDLKKGRIGEREITCQCPPESRLGSRPWKVEPSPGRSTSVATLKGTGTKSEGRADWQDCRSLTLFSH